MRNDKALKILLLEDNPDDIELIRHVLKKSGLVFSSECVDTREEFEEAMRRFKPDIILSDHGLPQFNSIEALKICKREKSSSPFILVTGNMSDEFAVACLKQGANDYILKGNLSRLPSAIQNAMKQRRLELLRRNARLELRTQNRELFKLNKELDNFVYSVSHNLRAPLASVTGLLHLAKIEDRQGTLRELHTMMEQSIAKLDETLKEILDYSRNVRNEVAREKIEWDQIIESCLTKLHYLPQAGQVKRSAEVIGESDFVSDQNRLGIILHNLFSNSLLYHDNQKPLVISIQIIVDEIGAKVTFTDNGIGIEPEILPKIFQMFYRGTELSKGAGLGLYIVKEMVTKLGGHIEAYSQFGYGTTFILTLPNLMKLTF